VAAGIHIALGVAELAGTASVTANGLVERFSGADLSASGTLTIDGQVIKTGAAALAGLATLSASGERLPVGAAALTVEAILSASGVTTSEDDYDTIYSYDYDSNHFARESGDYTTDPEMTYA
jgi:hypothetical protein